jgi:DNA-binding PadR family transcriptional regulator
VGVSTNRMMILGLVNWMQPVHGYDVRRELLSWSADKWANIQPGSIYHALRKMTEDGLLREVTTEQVGSRPARTTYEITPAGLEEFNDLLRGYWWEIKPGSDPFFAALAFLPALPREEAAAALRNRAAQLRASNDGVEVAAEKGWLREKPPHVTWMFELMVARNEGEIAWCEWVAGLVESGTSYVSERMPRHTGWERWRKQVEQ